MRRILLLVLLAAGCGAGWEPGTTGGLVAVNSKLVSVTTPCNQPLPARSVEVAYSSGTCVRYVMSSTPLNQFNPVIPSGTLGTVVSGRTASNAAMWVCDQSNPLGFTAAKYAPCWSGGVNNGVRRVRGPWDASQNAYAAASSTITGIVGRSFVVTLGTLNCSGAGCALPACNSQTALHWHQFGAVGNADNGMSSYTANNDPADGPGSNLTAPWPDNTSGSPCLSNATPSGYGEIYYTEF